MKFFTAGFILMTIISLILNVILDDLTKTKNEVTILQFQVMELQLLQTERTSDESHVENIRQVRESERPRRVFFKAKVTAYCPCEKCCGDDADGITSKGVDANLPGIASDPKRVAYGTVLSIPGYGTASVDDTGGAMRRASVVHLDVRFKTHQEALNWGVQTLEVEIVK